VINALGEFEMIWEVLSRHYPEETVENLDILVTTVNAPVKDVQVRSVTSEVGHFQNHMSPLFERSELLLP
jgi:hypothetical protein